MMSAPVEGILAGHAAVAKEDKLHPHRAMNVANTTKAIEAVAPFIAAEALREAADELEASPPKLQSQYVAHLRWRADQMEAGE